MECGAVVFLARAGFPKIQTPEDAVSLLIFAVIVLLLLCLAVWLIDTAPIGDATIKWVIKALAVVIAIAAIAQRAGLF